MGTFRIFDPLLWPTGLRREAQIRKLPVTKPSQPVCSTFLVPALCLQRRDFKVPVMKPSPTPNPHILTNRIWVVL